MLAVSVKQFGRRHRALLRARQATASASSIDHACAKRYPQRCFDSPRLFVDKSTTNQAWRRLFSTEIIQEDKPSQTTNNDALDRYPTLEEIADDFLDQKKYPVNSFQESEHVRNEAIQLIRQLTGAGGMHNIGAAMRLIERLRADCSEDPIDTEILTSLFRNYTYARGRKVGFEEMESLITTPNHELYAEILRKISQHERGSLVALNDIFRERWSFYKEQCNYDETMLRNLDEQAENFLIQLQARKQRLIDAIDMAKGLIERKQVPLYEETFLSILAAAILCPPEERPSVLQFLEWIRAQHEQGNNFFVAVKPESIFLFDLALQGHTGSDNDSPEWFLEGISWIGRKDAPDLQLTAEDYDKNIGVWTPGDPLKALALLKDMYQRWQNGNKSLFPRPEYYNNVLLCMEVSEEGEDATRAVELLDQMNSLDRPEMLPNFTTYMRVLRLLRKWKEEKAGVEAFRIVREMTEVSKTEKRSMRSPTTGLYATAWSAIRSAPVMESFLSWLEKENEDGNSEALPQIKYYERLIRLMILSNEPDLREKAMSILEKAQKLGWVTDNNFMSQVKIACSLGSDRGDAARAIQKAKEVFDDLEVDDLLINGTTKSYRHVLLRLAESGEAQKAEAVVTLMYDLSEIGRVQQPSVVEFNYVLEAWSNSSAPRAAERADAILQHMNLLHGGKIKDSNPNKRSCEMVLRCWNKSRLPEAKKRAEGVREILRTLKTFQRSKQEGWKRET